jgi:hypothetical protein
VNELILERVKAECRDMCEHGMNTIQLTGLNAVAVEKGKKYRLVTDKLAENIEFYRSEGLLQDRQPAMLGFYFVDNVVYNDVMGFRLTKHLLKLQEPPPVFYEIVTDLARQCEAERVKRGWPPFLYYPIDEATAEAVPFLRRVLLAIKQVSGALTLATQVYDRAENRPLDGAVDCWCMGYFLPDLDALKRETAQGRIFWCYPNFVACSRGVPNAARFTWGFGFWRSEFTCLIPWHYQAPVGNPYNDFDSTYGDWCCAYPRQSGPISTQRWEAVREGIDDYRYLYTLERLVAEGRGPRAVREEAGAWLAELRVSIKPQASYTQDGPWDGATYEKHRRRAAEYILKLQ